MSTDDKKEKPDPQGGEGPVELPKTTPMNNFVDWDEEIHLKNHDPEDGSGYDTRTDREGK